MASFPGSVVMNVCIETINICSCCVLETFLVLFSFILDLYGSLRTYFNLITINFNLADIYLLISSHGSQPGSKISVNLFLESYVTHVRILSPTLHPILLNPSNAQIVIYFFWTKNSRHIVQIFKNNT